MARRKKINHETQVEETQVKRQVSTSFIVAPSKSITTKRGILSEGCAIKSDDLSGGADSLRELIEKGYVIEK